jgi:ribose/xylose/arabinose/galactoside ABC-type transport system permease subunit
MSARERFARLSKANPWVGPLLALAVVYLIFAALKPDTFPTAVNLVTMVRQTAVVGIAATGATLIIVLGCIDLSVGSAVALTTVVVASLLRSGSSPAVAALGGAAVATLAGLSNGAMVARLGIPSFIVTLGTMQILRGAASGLAGQQKIDANAAGLESLVDPRAGVLGFPIAVWLLLLLAVLTAGVLRYTRFGRHIVAVGSSERTARLCGIRTNRVKVGVYGLAGLLTGLAGVLEFSTLTVGDPTDSDGLELAVIASVVIGGGSLSGGQGSILGTVFGALLMTVIRTGCNQLGLPNWLQKIVTGIIIVVAVTLKDGLRASRSPAAT